MADSTEAQDNRGLAFYIYLLVHKMVLRSSKVVLIRYATVCCYYTMVWLGMV